MIHDSLTLKLDYELTRLERYKERKRADYTVTELAEAYWAWVLAPYGRNTEWDSYCDMRDNVPRGTNARIRKDRRMSPFLS